MNTIHAIFNAAPDGTLHLPLPAGWQTRAIKVRAELEPVTSEAGGNGALAHPQPGCLKGFQVAEDFDEPLEEFNDYMA